jgi:Uncharacterised MFS-type transporter YbfB
MGSGRFAYTPILPLMHTQAGLSPQYGSALATANYAGYLAGALFGIVMPAVIRSVLALRAGLVLVVVTLALMGAAENHAAWLALRPAPRPVRPGTVLPEGGTRREPGPGPAAQPKAASNRAHKSLSRWTGSLANTRRRYRSPLGPHPVIGVAATSDRVKRRCDASPADRPRLAQSISSDHPPSGRRHG